MAQKKKAKKKPEAKTSKKKTVTLKPTKKDQKPITFRKGALHKALGVSMDKPIPPGKKKRALAGEFGPKVKKMAVFGFKGALKKGRETAAKKRKKTKKR